MAAARPDCAIAVAGNIVYTGVKIVRESVMGLMDVAIPRTSSANSAPFLKIRASGVQYHALRTAAPAPADS